MSTRTSSPPYGAYAAILGEFAGGLALHRNLVAGGLATTQTTSSLVRGAAVGLLSIPDRRDLVFDPTRNYLYITTGHGTVERYDVAAGTLLAPYTVGSSILPVNEKSKVGPR